MGILGIGRCTHPTKEEDGDEEEGTKKDDPPVEPEVPPLTAISATDWSTQVYAHMGSGCSVAVARSLRWPGAHCAVIMKEDKSANLYIGYGHEVSLSTHTMQPPPPMMGEPDDILEQADVPVVNENTTILEAAKKALVEAAAAEMETADE